LTAVYYQQTSIVSQITLVYNNTKTNETAVAKARIYKDESMIEWDVLINGIPISERG
jgi:hypothetical protein